MMRLLPSIGLAAGGAGLKALELPKGGEVPRYFLGDLAEFHFYRGKELSLPTAVEVLPNGNVIFEVNGESYVGSWSGKANSQDKEWEGVKKLATAVEALMRPVTEWVAEKSGYAVSVPLEVGVQPNEVWVRFLSVTEDGREEKWCITLGRGSSMGTVSAFESSFEMTRATYDKESVEELFEGCWVLLGKVLEIAEYLLGVHEYSLGNEGKTIEYFRERRIVFPVFVEVGEGGINNLKDFEGLALVGSMPILVS